MKKIYSTLFAIGLTVGLTGCGSDNKNSQICVTMDGKELAIYNQTLNDVLSAYHETEVSEETNKNDLKLTKIKVLNSKNGRNDMIMDFVYNEKNSCQQMYGFWTSGGGQLRGIDFVFVMGQTFGKPKEVKKLIQ
jgi:uncharacterized lipoprotein YehR (DUF1307 family)